MNGQEKQKLRSAFDSILRADYITLDNLGELGDLEEYFIDFFGILQSLLQKQDNFVSGRRGTGKTTNLLRGYYECLKSIAPKLKDKERLIQDDKVLYMDSSYCTIPFVNFVRLRTYMRAHNEELPRPFDVFAPLCLFSYSVF
ncbi:hypothetical protein, partial [Pseudoalteromonas sp. bablab_jr004]|uniref:hypothetical protein n=1 Tax=Pseudoalteromonas sp. bablab_jr004 TaxID=2755065 RepID=UPI0018F2DA63